MKSALVPAILAILLSNAVLGAAQTAPTPQPNSQAQKETHQAQFARLTANGAIFIYHSPAEPDPYAPTVPGGPRLLPMGTGFVIGLGSTQG